VRECAYGGRGREGRGLMLEIGKMNKIKNKSTLLGVRAKKISCTAWCVITIRSLRFGRERE
jgi:hypothetical protein